MDRYLETLFRRKEIFLIPLLIIPVMALVLFFGRGPQHTVKTSVWVDWNVTVDPVSSSRVNPNDLQAQGIRDWLATEGFRQEIMDKIGLTTAISQRQWPVPTPIQRATGKFGLGNIIGIGSLLQSMGLASPTLISEANAYGHRTIRDSIKVTPVGNNLLTISYKGPEPILGKRIIEETIILYNQKGQDLQTVSGRNQSFRVVDAPREPRSTGYSFRGMAMTVIMGVIVALAFSMAWAFMLTWTDNTVRSLNDVQRVIKAPLYVQVPAMPSDRGQPQDVARLTTARWYAEE